MTKSRGKKMNVLFKCPWKEPPVWSSSLTRWKPKMETPETLKWSLVVFIPGPHTRPQVPREKSFRPVIKWGAWGGEGFPSKDFRSPNGKTNVLRSSFSGQRVLSSKLWKPSVKDSAPTCFPGVPALRGARQTLWPHIAPGL